MRKILYTSCLLLAAEFAVGQNKVPQYEAYIETYSGIAVEKMNQYGIPASITLAQGILESGAGQSPLAVNANNHFGIKCHDWTGPSIRHDDDEKQECFRKYKHARESFNDHSIFLTTRSRYDFLFKLDKTDYKAWAKGLKEAGYATDPNYPARLIKIIEDYELYKYDKLSDGKSKNTYLTEEKTENIPPKPQSKPEEAQITENVQSNNNTTTSNTAGNKAPKVYYSEKTIGLVTPYFSHDVKEINGVKYVVAVENDSYESIAEEFGLKVREIYSINDVTSPAKLEAEEIVYIRPKKATSTVTFHVVQPDETMRDIAQKYGIKLSVLYKKNNMQEGVRPMIGQRIMLR